MNLHDLFAIAASRTPEKLALETPSTAWSYESLLRAADACAASFARRGLGKGDRALFFLGNCPEFVIAYLAVIRLGAILVPVNLRYRRLELSHILADSTPRLIISEQALLSILDEAGVVDMGVPILLAEQMADLPAGADGWHVPRVEGDDLAVIMYTSGTTGRSKGAMLTHNNLLATITGLLAAWGWQADDVLYLCLPLFHTHGLVVGMHCALAAGATIQLRAKFEHGTTLDELVTGRATLFFAVPTIYTRLVEELQTRGSVDFSHMRLFCSGSAPLAAETFTAFQSLTGHTILERYGMTETGMNLSNPYAGPRLPGSVGTPLPGVSMRIVDTAGREVAPGEEGELLLRGSNVFDGYWLAPEKTAESFSLDAQGRRWFHTGDLARQDPDTGYVTLLGRRHELIISGGFNIYPREIEELLMTHPAIAEAAVIGEANAEWGEVPVAYVVCCAAVEDGDLVAYCRSQLASFKVPQQFRHVAGLPRNAMGKLQKHLLKDA